MHGDSGYITEDTPCEIEDVRNMLFSRFDSIDYRQARQDAEPFIHDTSALNIWCADFFKQITENLQEKE